MKNKESKKTITLGEALQLKKRLGQEIADALQFRREQAWVPSPDRPTSPSWEEINYDLLKLIGKHSHLSEMIALTNAATLVTFDGNKIPLISAIIMVNDIRREIANLTKIVRNPNRTVTMFRTQTLDDIPYEPVFDRKKVLAHISNLKDKRDELTRILTKKNWETSLTVTV